MFQVSLLFVGNICLKNQYNIACSCGVSVGEGDFAAMLFCYVLIFRWFLMKHATPPSSFFFLLCQHAVTVHGTKGPRSHSKCQLKWGNRSRSSRRALHTRPRNLSQAPRQSGHARTREFRLSLCTHRPETYRKPHQSRHARTCAQAFRELRLSLGMHGHSIV